MIELFLKKPEELVLREVAPLPAPKDDQVKIKVLYAGICGSDLRVFKGSIAYAKYPIRPGHEALGVIVDAGKNVNLAIGTKVVVFPNTFCGTCEFCQNGQTNICREKKSFGINSPGVFGSEFVTEARFVVPVPNEMPDERAILVEPMAVTVHALKKAGIKKNTSVAVIGCGTEGLLSVALATYLGGDVTVIDVKEEKLAIAKQLGDIKTAHPQDMDGKCFDIVIEAAGAKASIEQSMQLVKPGGKLISIGISGEDINYPVIRIVRSEITIYGSIIYTLEDFSAAISFLNNPNLNIGPVLSEMVPIEQFQKAFQDALSGNFVKIVIKFKEA